MLAAIDCAIRRAAVATGALATGADNHIEDGLSHASVLGAGPQCIPQVELDVPRADRRRSHGPRVLSSVGVPEADPECESIQRSTDSHWSQSHSASATRSFDLGRCGIQ